MRRILVAVGSGIAGANTDRLADAFIAGARASGHEANKIFWEEIYTAAGDAAHVSWAANAS